MLGDELAHDMTCLPSVWGVADSRLRQDSSTFIQHPRELFHSATKTTSYLQKHLHDLMENFLFRLKLWLNLPAATKIKLRTFSRPDQDEDYN